MRRFVGRRGREPLAARWIGLVPLVALGPHWSPLVPLGPPWSPLAPVLAWAGPGETTLFANLQYQGFWSPGDCLGFAYESTESQWYMWLSEVVKLTPEEITRFQTVLMSVAQAGCLQQFEELANSAFEPRQHAF